MLLILTLLTLFVGAPQPADQQALAAKARQAQEAFQAGRFREAAGAYRELVDALPDIPGLRMNLGMALYLSGDPASAIAPLRKAVEGDPALPPAWLFLGTSLIDTGQPREAVEPLRTYLDKNPREPRAIQLLGDAYLQSDQPAQAVEVFDQLVKLDEKSAPGWFGLGRGYEALAGLAFDKLNQTAPESAYWLSLIADSRVVQQQYSSAFFFYRKALESNPKMRGIHAALANVYRRSEHADWAATEEQRELALGEPDCARETFVCLFLEGKLRELFTESFKQSSPEALYWQVKSANQLATQAFDRLQQLPSSVELHQFRAEVQRNQLRYWESVAEWKKALELSPGNPGLQRELAISLYLNRDYADAGKLVHQLLESQPDSAQLNFLAGDILLYEQKAAESVPFLEKAARLAPDMTSAHSSLGRAYMSIEKPERAIPHLKAALAEDEDGSLHYQLALAYQRTGQRDLAKETLTAYQKIKAEQRKQDAEVKEEVKITPPEE